MVRLTATLLADRERLLYLRVLLLLASAFGLVCPSVLARVLQVPATYPSIQGAINIAVAGDTIVVAPGTYFENIDFRGKKIVVASQYLLTANPDIINQTVIDGSQPGNSDSGSVVRFISREDSLSVLTGFTIRNGIGTLIPGSFAGGGILVSNSSAPIIRYNIIRNNSALIGAGIAVRNSRPIITNNALAQNSSRDGGGLWIDNSVIQVYHNIFHLNNAERNGGAIFIQNSYAVFANNSITNNLSPVCGGIFCNGGLWEISNCNFYQNQTANFSGCGDPGLGDTSKSKNYNLDPADIYANIIMNPLYTNAATFDFRLRCDSRLVDAGASIPKAYPQGGSREDIGMFEYQFRVGDPTMDGKVNLADATALINVIFLASTLECPTYMYDCDCSRRINISDLVALINYWAGYASVPSCLFTPAPSN